MKTIEIMSTQPRTIRVIERLDAAARALWEADCGIVPVIDSEGYLIGVVTDRDVCMASYIQGRALSEIPVTTVMARELATCRSEDPVGEVMQTMQRLQVHRLPVVDAHGKLVGVVSTNDLVRASHARPAAVDPAAVVRMLATIGAPRREAEIPASGHAQDVESAPKRAPAEPAKQAAKPRSPAKKKARKTTARKPSSRAAAPRKAKGTKRA